MSGPGDERADGKGFPFAKIVVVLAIAFGVGVGLCGLSLVAASAGFKSHEEFGVDSLGIANVSLVVMVLSAGALVLALVAWAVAAIVGAGKGSSETEKLLGDKDDEIGPK